MTARYTENGYPCPECSEWSGIAGGRERDVDGRFIRRRYCQPCGLNFATIEVVSPISYYRLASASRPARLTVEVTAAS